MRDRPKILIVDDDPQVLSVLEELLSRKDYLTVTADRGKKALDIIEREKIDLVLMDITLPDLDGIWLTRMLRQKHETRLIPIIMITAHTERDFRIKGIQAGADDFITKPLDREEILARIRTSLNLSYYRRELPEKKELETLIGEATDGIVVCSPDWKIEEANKNARESLDLPESEDINLLDYIYSGLSVSIPRKDLADLDRAHKTFYIFRKRTESEKPLCLLANLDVFKVPSGKPVSILLDLRIIDHADYPRG